MNKVSGTVLPPLDEMLKEFEGGSIPRSDTWVSLINGLYINSEQTGKVEIWYNSTQIIYNDIQVIQKDIIQRYDDVKLWHGHVDFWQLQVSVDKDQAAVSASAASDSEKAAALSEKNAGDSKTEVSGSASAAATSASKAKTSEVAADDSASSAASSEGSVTASEVAASGSASAAAASEQNAKTSETASSGSASAATTSELNAKASETKSKSQADRAKSEVDRAQKIVEDIAAFIPGMVINFAGTELQIPSGWQLCDGTGSTSNSIKIPDLRNRFIVGAGSGYYPGATGGVILGTTTRNGGHSHTVSIGSHTLTTSQIPSHSHPQRTDGQDWDRGGTSGRNSGNNASMTVATVLSTLSAGSSKPHTHNASSNNTGAHTHIVSTLPPYYALCYIIKL